MRVHYSFRGRIWVALEIVVAILLSEDEVEGSPFYLAANPQLLPTSR